MRNNQPVTNVEVVPDERALIVSKTDLKGQITYVNKDFIDISGFAEAELIGQPHSIVRHPDMPVEAFADMWKILKEGRPWIGVIKNRCKNGDHYWVFSTATPLFENDRVVGYMSVRTRPSHEQVAEAENAYRLFREGGAASLTICDGKVVKRGFSLDNWLKRRTIAQRIFAICALLTAGMLLVGLLGMFAVDESDGRLHTVYEERVVPLKQLKEVADAYAVSIVDISHKTRDGAETFDSGLVKVEQAQKIIARQWKAYVETVVTDEERRLVGDADVLMKNANQATERLKEILRNKDSDALMIFAAKDLYPAIDPISDKVGELVTLQLSLAKQYVDRASADAANFRLKFVVILLAFMAIAGVLTLSLVSGIRRPIVEIVKFFRALSEGRTDVQLDYDRRDELFEICDSARPLLIKSGYDLNEARRVADDNLRIRIALDCVSANLRIADNDGKVVYANKGLLNTLRQIEPGMRERQPGFSADTFIGSNIGAFYADPAATLKALREQQSTRQVEMDIGGRVYNVVTNPIINERGQRLGTVGEWVDRTAELNAQRSVTSLVSQASAGDLEARIDTSALEGFYKELGAGINSLVETSGAAIGEIANLLSRVADGDLTQTLTSTYQGTFGQLRDDANLTVTKLRSLVGEIQLSAQTINTAAKEIASGNQDLSVRTEEQASSLEETASSMEQLTSTVKQNADNARQAYEVAGTAQRVADQGGVVVEQVVSTMSAIRQSGNRIADITGVIDGIAFQTNILALNAAVEAARAGEQGRGFAVVATEVRNLAQRSAAAAKEIKVLIADSVEKVETGNKLVDQAGRTMEEVVSSIKRVAKIMGDISDASNEQSAGIEQVSLAVSQMDEVTQQNAALVEQAAAAAESLEEQAHQLVQTVAVFRVGDGRAARQLASPSRLKREPLPAKRSEPPGAPKAQEQQVILDDEWEEF